jgi:hypothetical protein
LNGAPSQMSYYIVLHVIIMCLFRDYARFRINTYTSVLLSSFSRVSLLTQLFMRKSWYIFSDTFALLLWVLSTDQDEYDFHECGWQDEPWPKSGVRISTF